MAFVKLLMKNEGRQIACPDLIGVVILNNSLPEGDGYYPGLNRKKFLFVNLGGFMAIRNFGLLQN